MNPISDRVLDLAVRIQQIPAPTFQEHDRAAFVRDRFLDAGLADVEMDAAGNVFGRIPGTAPDAHRPVVVSAHLDTVFPLHTSLAARAENGRIYGPGIGDNSVAVAGLLGIAWRLQANLTALPGDLWLVANVGEEGLGDLNGMKTVVDRFKDRPLAYLVLEGTALGQVYNQALRVRRYRVTFRTGGGHSWANFGEPSAIHELGKFITDLESLDLPEKPRTTYNVGIVAGGTTINTIAPQASLDLDLRSESPRVLNSLIKKVEELLEKRANEDVMVDQEIIGDRPSGSIPADHPLVQLACRTLEQHGLVPYLKIGSTDANIPLSRGLPAICIGLTLGGGGHTVNEFIQTEPLAQGLDVLLEILTRAWDTLGSAPTTG